MKNTPQYIEEFFNFIVENKIKKNEIMYKKYLNNMNKSNFQKTLPVLYYILSSSLLLYIENNYLMNHNISDFIFNSEHLTSLFLTYTPFLPGLSFVLYPFIKNENKRKKIKEIYNLSFNELKEISKLVSKKNMEYILKLQKEEKLEEYIDFYMNKKYLNKSVEDFRLKNLVEKIYLENKKN